MTNYRGFNLFAASTIVENSGNTFSVRGNTASENQQFKDWVDLLLDTSEFSAPFLLAAATGNIALRGIPINSEFSGYSGSLPDKAAYAVGQFKGAESTFDSENSRMTPSGSGYISSFDTVHLNFATRNKYLTVTGQAVSAPDAKIVFIHELVHAVNRQFAVNGDYVFEILAGSSPLEEQISIFFTNFVYQRVTGSTFERVGHLPGDDGAAGASASAVSYLRSAKLKSYEFQNGDFAPVFEFSDGSTVRKTYYRGSATHAGADRVEIYLSGPSFPDSKAREILAESAVSHADPLRLAQDKVAAASAYVAGKWEYAPEAIVVLSGERTRTSASFGYVDFEGPRPDSSGFIVVGARTNEPDGIFSENPEDARTLVFGSAGWAGGGVGTASLPSQSTIDFSAKDKLYGGDSHDILVSFSDRDGNELYGREGNDVLVGSEFGDLLSGGNDDDVLFGGAGDDELDGGDGDDLLIGGLDSNVIRGGDGTDQVFYAKSGDPGVTLTIEFAPSAGLQAIIADASSSFVDKLSEIERVVLSHMADTLKLSNISGENSDIVFDFLNPIAGNRGPNDYDSLDFTLLSSGLTSNINGNFLSVERYTLSNFDDELELSDDAAQSVIEVLGAKGNDTITLGGYLIATDAQQAVALYGGEGSDTLTGGDGADTLYAGADRFGAGTTSDDRDKLSGDDGNDVLYGGLGDDLLEGGFGADTLTGGKGSDSVYGGFGDDVLVTELNDGDDDIDGGLNGLDLPIGDGTDTVLYKYDRGNSTIKVLAGAWFSGQSATDFGLSITGAQDAAGATGTFGNDTLTSIERASVEAGSGADTLVLDGKSYTGYLGYVDLGDHGSGFANYDTVNLALVGFGATIDLRDASKQSLEIDDWGFNTTLKLRNAENAIGTSFDDVIYGTNAETGSQISGLAGEDKIYGGNNADDLQGGSGDDLLVGGGGADKLDGGSGADTLVVDALDIIARGEVEDRLYWKSFGSGLTFDNLLRGGLRTVVVEAGQSWAEQVNLLLNSPELYKGALGETYQVVGTGAAQGLRITMASGEVVNLANWSDGEYGIRLETTKRRVTDFTYLDLPMAGLPLGSLGGFGLLSEFQINNVRFAVSLAPDPAWRGFAGDRFSLSQLQAWANQLGPEPSSNSINGTGDSDTINGRHTDDRISGGGGNDTVDGFAGDDSIRGDDGNDTIRGGAGADRLEGGAGDDVLEGGAGNDTIVAGAGRDVIIVRAGGGSDVITADALDIIRFEADIDPASVTVSAGSTGQAAPSYGSISGGNLSFSFGDDKVTILGASFGQVEFADGTVRTASTLARAAIAGATTSGDDTIIGFGTPDGIRGGQGNDFLNGLGGNDRYFFSRGDGQDRVEDGAGLADQIIFADDILPENITVSLSYISSGPRQGQELVRLSIAGTADWVEFVAGDIEQVRFANGTIWRGTYETGALSSAGTAGNDRITLSGKVTGFFNLGLGNDVIIPLAGAQARYEFGLNSGHDRIELYNYQQNYGGFALVNIVGGLGIGDLQFRRLGDGLSINILGTNDTLDIVRLYEGQTAPNVREVDLLLQIPGESVSAATAERIADVDQFVVGRQSGTSANDILTGAASGDRLNGGAGNDQLDGGDGSDLLFGGMGNDSLTGGAGNDVLFGESGNDLLLGGDGDDALFAGSGTDDLRGGAGSDQITGNGLSVIEGGAGSDAITSQQGDIIRYNIGDGFDQIYQSVPQILADGSTQLKRTVIEFGAGIDHLSTTVTLEGWAVYLNVNGSTTDRIRFDRLFQGDSLPEVRFAGGVVWRETELLQRLFNPDNAASAATTITSSAPDWDGRMIAYTYGGGGNDTLDNSSASASEYNFVFAPGGGTDTILSSARSGSDLFLSGFDPDQMIIGRSGANLQDITISFSGSSDSVIIRSQELGNSAVARVNDFHFNGVRVFDSQIRERWIAQSSTSGDDTITAFDGIGGDSFAARTSGNDRLQGGLGNDTVIGGSGDDTYVFNRGDGSDLIRDLSIFNANAFAGYDVLQLGFVSSNVRFAQHAADNKDLLVTFIGSSDQITIDEFFALGTIEEIEFSDGVVLSALDVQQLAIEGSASSANSSIRGTASPDTLTGGGGNDTLDGLEGADRYIFRIGDGHDVLADTGAAESNFVSFGEGISVGALSFTRVADNLKISVSTSDSLTINGHFSGAAVRSIGQFVFADGTRISAADIDQLYLSQLATSGDDVITGFAASDLLSGGAGADLLLGGPGNDTLVGGVGNDNLNGQQGADLYLIDLNDGQDVIGSTGDALASDVVRFGSGIAQRDLEFVRLSPTSPDLIVKKRGSTQQVTVTNYFGGLAVKQFELADGTIISTADVAAALANSAPISTSADWRVELAEGGQSRFEIPTGLFTDDADSTQIQFEATLADGSPLPDWLQLSNGVFTAQANDTQVGTWSVQLIAIDKYGARSARTVKFDVINSNEPPVGLAMATQNAAIGSAFSFTVPANLISDQDTSYNVDPAVAPGTYTSKQGGTFIATSTGSFTYVPLAGYVGPDSVFVPFNVGTDRPLERTFNFTSTGLNLSGSIPANLAPARDVLTMSAQLSDGTPLPAWLSFDGTTFNGTPSQADQGPLAVDIVVTDSAGGRTIIPFAIRVGSANAAPIGTALPLLAATQNQEFSFTIPDTLFTDTDRHDRLQISATLIDGSSLPSWLSFDGQTFTGTPQHSDVGSLSLKIIASDISGATATVSTTLAVADANDAPIPGTTIADQLAIQGSSFTFAVPSASFTDLDAGDQLTLTATLDTGDALPTWLSFADGVFSGIPGNNDTGVYRLKVTASDLGGLSTFQYFLLGVRDINDAPTVAETAPSFIAPAGKTSVYRISPSLFADSDDAGYRLNVTLADGSSLPSWAIFDTYTDTITFSPTTAQLIGRTSQSTEIQIRITAVDTRGASTSTTFNAVIGAPETSSTLIGGGASTIAATTAYETINPGAGNQTISGAGSGDRIIFGRGSGLDVVNLTFSDNQIGAIVEFGPGITLADLILTRADFLFGTGSNKNDLGIKISGTSDELQIYNQFEQTLGAEAIREFRFADGTSFSAAEIVALISAPTANADVLRGSHKGEALSGAAGNDVIYGLDGDDVIDGGSGDDILYGDSDAFGYGGSDVFLFGRGSGKDIVFADTASVTGSALGFQLGIDTIRFGAGIDPSDLIVTHLPGYPSEVGNYLKQDDAGSLLIRIADTDDSIKVDHQFYLRHPNQTSIHTLGVERFEFADGTIMNRAQFEALITLAPTTSGDDAIFGGAAADTLEGGAGNDLLVGEDGGDTYVYKPGDGNDRILETAQFNRATPLDNPTPRAGDIISFDAISFGIGIAPEDLIFTKPDAQGEDLVISFKNRVGQIYIEGQFRNILHGPNIAFPLAVSSYFGVENAAIDEIRFADGTKWSLADIYSFSVRSTAGDDVIDGFFRSNETLDGGAGNDLLMGRNGNDTYVFARGYGNDRIKEFGWFYSDGQSNGQTYTPNDQIRFNGVASSDVTTSIGAGGTFIFRINNTGETLTITADSEFANFKSIQFSDTTWNASQFQARWTVASGTSGNDVIYGFVGNDIINGGDGNDILQGGQNSQAQQGGLGFDTLNGGNGNDLLTLESSDNDVANGDDGDDTFRIAMTLPYWTTATLAGVDPERGKLDYSASIKFGSERGVVDGGAGLDRLILGGKLADYWRGDRYLQDNGDGSHTIADSVIIRNIELVEFADATVSFSSLATADFRYRPGVVEGTASAENLNGNSGSNSLYGYGGNDTLNGFDGDDFLIGGAGTDIYIGGAGTDIVDFGYDTVGWTINLTTGQAVQGALTENLSGIEGAYGSASADSITGSSNGDILAGGKGDDTITAGSGDDIVEFEGYPENYYGAKDGYDAIDGGSGTDTIRATGDNAVIGLVSVTGIETISANGFAGVTIEGSGAANILNFSSVNLVGIGRIDGGAGNDVITGSVSADLIIGGAGDDNLSGGDGDDTFWVAGTTDGFDAIQGGAGNDRILASQGSTRIGLSAITGIELVSGNGQGSVFISGSSAADNLDFSSVTLVEITRIDGGSGNDVITGTASDDVLQGSGGDDILAGGLGNDVFQYTGTSGGFDNVQGGAGTNAVIALANSTVIGLKSITNIQSISANGYTGVSISGSSAADNLDFSTISLTSIARIDGGAGNDTVTGSSGADTLLGSGGDDTLNGGAGNDVFQFTGTANGADTINGGDGTDTIAALAAGTVIGLTSISAIETITSGGFASVTIAGSAGADALDFTNVTLSGITSISGAAGNDFIYGSVAGDTILGGADNDSIFGLAGDDTLNGGAGTNVLDGGSGTDVAQYSGTAGSYAVSDNGNGTYTLSGSGINDTLVNVENLNFSDGTVTLLSRVGLGLTLTGTSVGETLIGSSGADTITGLGGNDTLIGNGGDDVFRITSASDGFDSIDGGSGVDSITATANGVIIGLTVVTGIELITAANFSNVSIAGSGNADTLNFSSVTLNGIARIDGGAGNDVITGSLGGDTILGSGGDDALDGGDGNDTFQFTGTTNGFDAIVGGSGNDTISALANSTVIGLTSVTGIETVTAGTFTGVSISGSANADVLNFTGVALTSISLIDGGGGNDTLTGSAAADTIRGSAGDDVINTADGNDTIQFTGTASGFDAVDGGAGTDTITALANSTVIGLSSLVNVEAISAGTFTGVYIAGSGSDNMLDFSAITLTNITRVEGGAGNDIVIGNGAANTLWGGIGNDVIDGGAGNDNLQGDDGDDTIKGGAGTDTINGGTGVDAVDYSAYTANLVVNLTLTTSQTIATGDSDTVTNVENVVGGSGSDTLTGSSANNLLTGGSGNDRLTGGAGNDVIAGGIGTADVAVFAGLQASYTVATNAGVVTIVDNQAATDGNDGTDTISGIEKLEFKGGVQVGITSPIILDLDGNGIDTVSAADSEARFDLDGDGLADDTSWISAGDAFLYLDRDRNGRMSGVEEISFVDDVPNARTDLAGLAAFDSNDDRVLDARDARFADFGVWRDADGDGAVDEGETASLAAVGIRSINLVGTPVDAVTEFGEVAIANTGSFTLTNGTTRSFADAALTYFSAATNLPSLGVTQYDFDRKASKFRISAAGGALTVGSRNARSGIDPLAGQLGANTILTFRDGDYGMFAPVVLDLDGDGVDLVSRKNSRASFDYGGDGAADDTGWIGRDDGFLVIDRNNDGLITDAAELSLASEDEEARSGLQGLVRLDSNGDRVVDSKDARFGELRVWRDGNGDGRTDAGELLSLEQAGVVAIRLNAVTPTQQSVKLDRNVIAATASFVRTNGTTSTAADVSLAYRPVSAPTASVAAFDLSERFAGFGPDMFLTPREIDRQNRFDLLPSINELAAMLGRADAETVSDIFDRVSATATPEQALLKRQVTVAPQATEAVPLPPRVFDPSSLYFAMYDSMRLTDWRGGVGEPAEVGVLAVAPFEAGQVAYNESGNPDPVLNGALSDELTPVAGEPRRLLDRSAHELWSGPAWIGSLPVSGASAEATPPSIAVASAALSNSPVSSNDTWPPEAAANEEAAVTTPIMGRADRPRLDPAQHELWGGPLHISFIPNSPEGEEAGVIVQAAASEPMHGMADVEIARKLAMIRQDLSTFGATGVGEIDRLRQLPVQAMDIFA